MAAAAGSIACGPVLARLFCGDLTSNKLRRTVPSARMAPLTIALMTRLTRPAAFMMAVVLWTATAHAQIASTGTASSTQSASDTDDASRRPSTTTFFGDTGLWYVPTADVLAHGAWSVSAYRRGTNYAQGYTNVADFAGTFAAGIGGRTEVFGSFLVDTRIARDTRPLFVNDPTFGGVVSGYPGVNQAWTGDNIGDLYLGAKVNLWSEARRNPLALAVRGIVKVPTGKESAGVSTGKADVEVDVIASKEAARTIDLSEYAGYAHIGSPNGFSIPTSAFRWGAGAAFPSRSPFRIFTELNGTVPSSSTTTITGAALIGADGSLPPLTSNTEDLTSATIGVTVQASKGFFIGGGVSWNVPQLDRNAAFTTPDIDPGVLRDYWDWQVRIGFHPRTRVYVQPPPPPPPPELPVSQAPEPHTLTVKAECNPCTVEVSKSSTVTATVQDSMGCAVTYRWSSLAGTLANPAVRQTLWTAPPQEGSVPVSVTVACPSDGKAASDIVNIRVVRPVARSYTFEDVHFDFDRYSLRPEATRVLDEAVSALRSDPTLRVQIEGHTCNIGTAEYNLALGDRRANAVKDYLVSRGVPVDRLTTISYGEERPKFDNAREETRRLNRRAALVVNLRR
jgi:outer membrane protein OmpA-like peptidoglycan-associated protein